MFACICQAVTDKQVNAAIAAGADTVEAVADTTQACTGCGSCRERIEDMIAEHTRLCPLVGLRAS